MLKQDKIIFEGPKVTLYLPKLVCSRLQGSRYDYRTEKTNFFFRIASLRYVIWTNGNAFCPYWCNCSPSISHKSLSPLSPNQNTIWTSAWISASQAAILLDLNNCLLSLALKSPFSFCYWTLITADQNFNLHSNLTLVECAFSGALPCLTPSTPNAFFCLQLNMVFKVMASAISMNYFVFLLLSCLLLPGWLSWAPGRVEGNDFSSPTEQ